MCASTWGSDCRTTKDSGISGPDSATFKDHRLAGGIEEESDGRIKTQIKQHSKNEQMCPDRNKSSTPR